MIPASSNPPIVSPNVQLRRDNAASLLAWLSDVVGDGQLTAKQIEQVRGWTRANHSLDGIRDPFFAEIMARIVAGTRVTADDRLELLLAIDNVLVLTERGIARAAATGAPPPTITLPPLPTPPAADDAGKKTGAEIPLMTPTTASRWQDQPVTEAQRNLITALGGTPPPHTTRGEASDLIESLLAQKSPSRRQKRQLRFWGRELRTGEGPRHAASWLEAFEVEDPDRKRAWELFLREFEEDLLQPEAAHVPIGLGTEYLHRIKRGGTAAQPKGGIGRRRGLPGAFWISCLFAAGCVTVAVMVYLKRAPGHGSANHREKQESGKTASTAALDNAAYVASLKIGGAIGGTRMQVMIDGTLFATGDIVDAARGLLVMKIDGATRRVTFIDTTGKTYVRTLD
ncbi:MAG: hypothetical protein Q7S40_00375 [Opitutaceae bacterium]|nr:hypothetical protein [Opitutaceae bacterium]